MQTARFWLRMLPLLLLLPACEPDEPLPEFQDVVFQVPLTISPGADTVARGDTLWLNLNVSDSLLDLRSNQRYRVQPQDLDMTIALAFKKLAGTDRRWAGAALAFSPVARVGQLREEGGIFRSLIPIYDNQRYRAQLGLVPLQSGVYALSVTRIAEVGRAFKSVSLPNGPDGKPRDAKLREIYHVINDGNVHFHLQQQHTQVVSTLPDASESTVNSEQKATLAFVVR